jgi:predicted metal-dependent phosphoesterase TrpH
MRRSLGPLLCELHAHSRWSDGVFTVAELVDLHGRSGFDVLGITDHAIRRDDPWLRSRRPVYLARSEADTALQTA